VIPVFKIDGTYYSVCRGVEIPFRQIPEGLEWALEPSSMIGTKIIIKDSTPFIIIRDQQAEAIYGHTSETELQYHQYGQAHPLMRIEKPSWLLDPTMSPPKSKEDFVGIYQPAWFPYYRLKIQKDSEKYLLTYSEIDIQENTFKAHGKTEELTPLSGTLGLTKIFGKTDSTLIFHSNLRRYEIVHDNKGSLIRIPLVRIDQLSSDKKSIIDPELIRIGIPSWH
jgi:hypothetical protein